MEKRLLVLALCSVILFGCSSVQQYGNKNGPESIVIESKAFDIVGPVRTELTIYSVLGFPPIGGLTLALFNWGGSTYDALLQEARRIKADDVVNITMDTGTFSIFTFLYNQRTYIVNGLAIKYKDAEKPRAIILQ
jgi:hypothetical protein